MTKFLVFSDLHSEIIDNYESRIYEIIGAAYSNKVQAIINIGDLGYHGNTGISICPVESQPVNYKYFNEQQTSKYFERTQWILRQLNTIPIPKIHVIGNHDVDFASKDDVVKNYNLPGQYYYVDINDIRLIVLDTNFFLKDGQFVDYYRGNNFDQGSFSILPQEQIDWFQNLIETDKNVFFLSHHPLKMDKRGINNYEVFSSILKKYPDKHFTNLYGHKHLDAKETIGNCTYININSSSYFWLGEEKKISNYWSEKTIKESPMLEYVLRYPETLYCIIEIKENECNLQGIESSLTKLETNFISDNNVSASILNWHWNI